MKVSDLLQARQISPIETPKNRELNSKEKNTNNVNFADTMKDFLEAVNNDKIEAGKQVEGIISGKSENLAGAMAALEESSLSFQLMLEIRNKLVQSFQEMSRMPV